MLLEEKLRSLFAIAAVAFIGLLPVFARIPDQAATQPAASASALAESLNIAATRLQVKDALEIHAYVDWPLVTWTVCFDADAAWALLQQQATSARVDPATG